MFRHQRFGVASVYESILVGVLSQNSLTHKMTCVATERQKIYRTFILSFLHFRRVRNTTVCWYLKMEYTVNDSIKQTDVQKVNILLNIVNSKK